MGAFILRNLKVYIRDKGTVFFSFFGIVIILLLYVLFLGDSIGKALENLKESRYLLDTYILSGVLEVSTITTTLGVLGICTDDTVSGKKKDLIVSGLAGWEISCGYIMTAILVSFGISLITLGGAEIYIVMRGGRALSLRALLEVIYVLGVLVICSAGVSFLLVSLIKSHGAYSGLNVVVGTLSGFMTGVYIPFGSLNAGMQTVVKAVPMSHGGVLLRKLMMEDAIHKSFLSVPEETVMEFKKTMGITLFYKGQEIGKMQHLTALFLGSAVFYFIASLIRRHQMA
ncbi:MAG: hypothetical protein E7256_04530 [Lachnospiraceae bacterium]|nr:hypothetical protein [Lachnospiraceae bacterium]